MLYFSEFWFIHPKLVLDGTVDKTWFKLVKTGQNWTNLRKAINHRDGCETIEDV